MEITAKLNTLNILFNIYNEKAESKSSMNWQQKEVAAKQAQAIARELEQLSKGF
ncbi:MAG: hypothetical protein IPN22_07265 [Bacteroidetes bacterium]|nr:hypothetical protein [Bacteroidota bacterium]